MSNNFARRFRLSVPSGAGLVFGDQKGPCIRAASAVPGYTQFIKVTLGRLIAILMRRRIIKRPFSVGRLRPNFKLDFHTF